MIMAKVKHIALIKFKSGTSEEQIDKVFADLMDLSETIPGIEDYVSGPNNSPEGLNQGYTHGFVMTFENAAARDAYVPHPDHQRVQAAVMPLIENVVVFDFEL
jgi:quinol monooxygenase YgiN